MHRKPVARRFIYAGLVCSSMILTCDESLPPYRSPQNILKAQIGVTDGIINREVNCSFGTRIWNLNPVPFQINVTNTFDETLQGLANAVYGTMEVWKKDTPGFGKTFTIFGVIDPLHVQNNVLSLDPGETFVIGVTWYHDDDQNRRIWKVYNNHLSTAICARARLKVFKEAPEIFTPEFEIEIRYDIDTAHPTCDQ
jgi:hypothetical protein